MPNISESFNPQAPSRWVRAVVAATVMAGGLALAPAEPAAAVQLMNRFGARVLTAAPVGPHTFVGSCRLAVRADLAPIRLVDPETLDLQTAVDVVIQGTGRCTGRLDGERVVATPVALRGYGRLVGTCAVAVGPIYESLQFGDADTTLQIVHQATPGWAPVSMWRGAHGGRAAATSILAGSEHNPSECWGMTRTYTTLLRTVTAIEG